MMEEIRAKIDRLDAELNILLDKRADLAKEIGQKKKESGSAVFAPGREDEILTKLQEQYKSDSSFPLKSRLNIFREIFSASRTLQKELVISYLGPESTFTHQAALRQFSELSTFVSASSISTIFKDVEKGRADYGVVPIENSTEGIVTHTLDKFFDSDCKICAELLMEINLNLLSSEDEFKKIKKIYSHPQPLGQSKVWLEENFPNVELVEVSSTAVASQKASNEAGTAAVASSLAAKIYDLNILAESIEDVSENITRFFVIGKELAVPSENSKTTIMFSIKDRIGALHDMLMPFKKSAINLTKIESRPSKTKVWEYVFFVDFMGHAEDPKIKKAVAALAKDCVFLKVLGSYPPASSNL